MKYVFACKIQEKATAKSLGATWDPKLKKQGFRDPSLYDKVAEKYDIEIDNEGENLLTLSQLCSKYGISTASLTQYLIEHSYLKSPQIVTPKGAKYDIVEVKYREPRFGAQFQTWLPAHLDSVIQKQPYIKPVLEHRSFSKIGIPENALIVHAAPGNLKRNKQEMLELSIMDAYGELLYHSYFKPINPQRVPIELLNSHSITRLDLETAPEFADEQPAIKKLLFGKTIIGLDKEHTISVFTNALKRSKAEPWKEIESTLSGFLDIQDIYRRFKTLSSYQIPAMAREQRIEIEDNADCTLMASAIVQILHALDASDLRDKKQYVEMSASKSELLRNILRHVLLEHLDECQAQASEMKINRQVVIDCIDDIFYDAQNN